MKILLLGKNGQLGWELQRSLAPLGELIALDRHSSEHCGDLSRPDELAASVRAIQPDVIVNAAAHTAVDKAESEPELAHTLNALAPEVLAVEAAKLGAWLVHYSTDYVFDGGGNFAKTMLRLAQERDTLSVINDQFGAPTGADLIADVTAHAIRHVLRSDKDETAGIYHLVAGGETSWFDYASHVIGQARRLAPHLPIKASNMRAVPTTAFPTPAKRPHNSRLNTDRLQATFGLSLPHWQRGVNRMLAEIL